MQKLTQDVVLRNLIRESNLFLGICSSLSQHMTRPWVFRKRRDRQWASHINQLLTLQIVTKAFWHASSSCHFRKCLLRLRYCKSKHKNIRSYAPKLPRYPATK